MRSGIKTIKGWGSPSLNFSSIIDLKFVGSANKWGRMDSCIFEASLEMLSAKILEEEIH